MARPEVGDVLYAGRRQDGSVSEVFRKAGDGTITDITGEVAGVDIEDGSFSVIGKQVLPNTTPWTATADKDSEASDVMLRGQVRSVATDWHAQCWERIEHNMRRFRLSTREREIAWLFFAGHTNKEIGLELCISEHTVKNINTSTFRKLMVDGTEQAMLRLLDIGGFD